jgi:hypothetical protein
MRIEFPQWRAEHEAVKYPFAGHSRLANDAGQVIVEGTLLDAALYPVGGRSRCYLSRVVVDHATVTLYAGDDADPLRCSGSFAVTAPPDNVPLADALGRPAGLLVSEGRRLALFASFGVGTHAFEPADTEFAATACFPTPEVGVRGFLLDDGTLLTGDVWLVGDDGVVLRRESVTVPARACGGADTRVEVIRVDVVGDPLFRRRLCAPNDLFTTPRFLRSVTFKDAHQSVQCFPNADGDIKFTVLNDLKADTVLRITPTARGNLVEVVGSHAQQEAP